MLILLANLGSKGDFMARLAFLIGYKGQDPAEKPPDAALENLKGVFTCKQEVANFLGIETFVYTPSNTTVTTRAAYTKNIMKRDPVTGVSAYADISVPAGQITYAPSNRARAKTVILKTGARAKKSYRTISLTFPSNVTVAQIGEALAEYIPDGKIQRTASNPSVTEIFPQYTIKGGRTYSLGLKADAETSTSVTAPATKAEQTTVVTTAK